MTATPPMRRRSGRIAFGIAMLLMLARCCDAAGRELAPGQVAEPTDSLSLDVTLDDSLYAEDQPIQVVIRVMINATLQ